MYFQHLRFDFRPPIDLSNPATRVGFQATPFIAGCTDQLQMYNIVEKKKEQKASDAGKNFYEYVPYLH